MTRVRLHEALGHPRAWALAVPSSDAAREAGRALCAHHAARVLCALVESVADRCVCVRVFVWVLWCACVRARRRHDGGAR